MAVPQKIMTEKYGVLNVVRTFHEGRRPVHLLENGAYVFDSGLPVSEVKEIKEALPASFCQEALDWLDKRHESIENPPRPIKIKPDGSLIFEDGIAVTNVEDIVAFFEPGPFRDAALICFAKNLAEKDQRKPGPMDIRPKKKAPPPKKAAPKASAPGKGKTATPPPSANAEASVATA